MNELDTVSSQKKEQPFLGRTIVDGNIRYSSISQIKTFDPSSDGGCNRRWFYAYVLGEKLPRTQAQTGGSNHAEALEHWLRFAEDVLGPVLQPAKKFFSSPGADLQCEEPLGDIKKALMLRDALLKSPRSVWTIEQLAEIESVAGLTAAGIPITGAADVRHTRGEYVDSDGILKKDPQGTFVVHIDDLKTTSRIYPHKILKGPNAGTILQSFCKTDAEVCEDTQLIGYARHAINKYPRMTHARLSLVYASTSKREAVKRTGIISVEQVLRRWTSIENTVRHMEQVATATNVEDVTPNVDACGSYNHVDPHDHTGKKSLPGCGYKYQCPLHITQVVSNMLGQYKESAMSLFDQVPGAVPVVPPVPVVAYVPPLDPVAHAAEVELEKAKLLASIAAQQASQVVSLGFCSKCGTQLSAKNASKLPSGEIRHMGCATGVVAQPVTPTIPTVPQLPYVVTPPDQPKTTNLLDTAAALPPEEIAQITDPALKEKVEQHAREHAARAAAEAARIEAEKVAAGTSVWCPGGSQKIVISSVIGVNGYSCQCGKHWSVKALKPTQEGDQHVADVPRHKPVKKESAAETPAPATAMPAPQVPAVPSVPVAAPAVPVARTGTNIFIETPTGRRELTHEEISSGEPYIRENASVAPPAPVPVPQVIVAPVFPPVPRTLPAPEAMHGAADGFGGEDFPALPAVVAPAAPQMTNGNGHHAKEPVTRTYAHATATLFRIALVSGKSVSVIATTMIAAMMVGDNYAADINDEVKSIEKFAGEIINGVQG